MIRASDASPAFVYSVGMAQCGMPDILMFLDSEYVKPQLNFLTSFLQMCIEGRQQFTADGLIASLNGMTKVVSDPDIEYTFTLLNANDTDHAIHDYMCRCHYFRRMLGDPQVLVVSSEFNPSWESVTAPAVAA